MTISELKEKTGNKPLLGAVLAQVQSVTTRTTKTGKPFLELALADSTGHVSLKVWSASPDYAPVEALHANAVLRVDARWTAGEFGVEASGFRFSDPEEGDLDRFFAGDPVIREKQERDFEDIRGFCAGLRDPRLVAFCRLFLERHGDRFRRTAAARKNHHARRGGLVEHVCQMMRSADALCAVYPELNRDLLIAGVLVHDCGKLWENCYPERGFSQVHTQIGEMLGHIPLGIELTNHLWHELSESAEAVAWDGLQPSSDDLRRHLLHLIGSHHGQFEFGSPVLPRTPEAFALHHIDNLDAKLEMARDAYANARELSAGVYERVFPLPAGLVEPLPHFVPPDSAEHGDPAAPDPAG